MSRLLTQLHRLYGLGVPTDPVTLIDAQGLVRAMVLELGNPAAWSLLSSVWQGVQADFALPAPAIAVNGLNAYQLWFSLQLPVPASQAITFMEALRAKYLPDVAPHRIRLMPFDAATHAAALPPRQVHPDQWSSFLAQDLAPVFNDTPWLDLAPNQEGQADLLSKLASISAQDLEAAMVKLRGASAVSSAATKTAHAPAPTMAPGAWQADPRQFLLAVMNDDSVALHLRIDAARALLSSPADRCVKSPN